MGQDKDREITQQPLSQVKKTQFGEINLIYYQLNQRRIMTSKPKS